MSSIIRPTPAQQTRRLIVLVCAVVAVLVPAVQMLGGMGQSQAEFAADSDATLRVAGWAFSIWSLIYLGILAYAVRQVLPATGESVPINRLGWPSAAAFLLIAAWIVAAAVDAEIATIVIIWAALLILLGAMLTIAGEIRRTPRLDRDRWLTLWPLGLLAGWLTIAAPVNILTVATGNDALLAALPPLGWALLAVVGVVFVGLAVTWRLRLLAYPLPIAWGLIGVFTAEQARQPTLAFSALAGAVLLLIGAVVLAFGLRRGVEKVA